MSHPMDATRHRLEVTIALLQDALASSGCLLSGWPAEVLLYKAWRMHQQMTQPESFLFKDSEELLGQPWDELVDTLAPVVAHLAEGLRDSRCEYRLIALIHDRYGGVQDMHQLQARFESVFSRAATDAELYRINNT
jgi:hypothetical protein